MAGIVKSTSLCAGGGHSGTVVTLDGEDIDIGLSEVELNEALSALEKLQMLRLLARRLRQQGVTLAQFLNRVLLGQEATNVKSYLFFGPGLAITLTNMNGAGNLTYTDILPGPAGSATGQRVLMDLTGCVEFRAVTNCVLPGTGPYRLRILRENDGAVFYESPNIAASGATERELDTDWTAIPSGASPPFAGIEVFKIQARSAVGTDDPVFRRSGMLLR